jgi:heterotetrameric sarcosine oxidase delta subunit
LAALGRGRAGGDATLHRPAPDAPEAAWVDYVYLRDNPCGPHDELWFHGAGCRSWFKVRRNTRTHDIIQSGAVNEMWGEVDGVANGSAR